MADFFNQISQVTNETWITMWILFVIVIAIIYILSIWIYKRAPANMGFIRTGLLGTKVCLGRGALVLPVFHEVTWVSLETIKLIVSRSREQAFLTQDNIRVDMVAELYTHVGHSKAEMLQASRSLGEKTFDPEQVRNLLEAKVVSALRSYSATRTLKELHENREILSASIKESVAESFRANGLVLEEVTIVTLEQAAKEHFRRDNVFDAEGLKIITEITSNARRAVHNTEKRTSVAIRQRDLDTQLEMLEIEKTEAFARASQDKEVANEQALKLQEKQVYILDQRLRVDSKEISNEQDLEKLRTERDLYFTEEARRREIAEVQKALALELEEKTRQIELISKTREEELVNIARNLALEKSEKDRQIELIGKAREEELATIARNLAREWVPQLAKADGQAGRKIMVRCNALDTGLIRDELAAVIGPDLYGVSVGKTESVWDLREIDRIIGPLEAAAGLNPGAIKVIPWIESAKAVMNAPRPMTARTNGVDGARSLPSIA